MGPREERKGRLPRSVTEQGNGGRVCVGGGGGTAYQGTNCKTDARTNPIHPYVSQGASQADAVYSAKEVRPARLLGARGGGEGGGGGDTDAMTMMM